MEKKAGRSFWLLVLGCLLWTAFIFLHSLQGEEASARESGILWEFLQKFFPWLGHGLLRKLGHFFEFTVLGIWLTALCRSEKAPERFRRLAPALRGTCLSLLTGLLVALCDEGIQTRVPGRSGELRDVLIDFGGVVTGLLLTAGIKALRQKKKR